MINQNIKNEYRPKIKRLFQFSSILLIIVIMLSSQKAVCQDQIFNGARRKTGFQVGFGDQDWKLGFLDLSIDVAYTYEVYFFQFQYYFTLLAKEKWGIDFLFQPQFNLVRLKTDKELSYKENGFEFGLNGGIIIRRGFFQNKLNVYGLISSGPHFISDAPGRQANGFIFSDNISMGMNYRIYENVYLDFRPGFRHISNAGFQSPNKGVNTHTFTCGLMIVL